MARRLLAGFALIGLLLVGTIRLISPPVQAGAEPAATPALLSGKPVFVMAKDNVSFTLEKPEVRQLGGRTFVVGRQLKDDPYKITKPFFAGTIWVPVDGITQLVELDPLKAEK